MYCPYCRLRFITKSCLHRIILSSSLADKSNVSNSTILDISHITSDVNEYLTIIRAKTLCKYSRPLPRWGNVELHHNKLIQCPKTIDISPCGELIQSVIAVKIQIYLSINLLSVTVCALDILASTGNATDACNNFY